MEFQCFGINAHNSKAASTLETISAHNMETELKKSIGGAGFTKSIDKFPDKI